MNGNLQKDMISSYYLNIVDSRMIQCVLFAMADALVRNIPFDIHLKYWCKRYPRAGYGRMFRSWIYSFIEGPYNSWGNGSAMRVSSIGAFADNLDDCLSLAKTIC